MRLAQKIAFKSEADLDDLPLTIVTITNLSLKKAVLSPLIKKPVLDLKKYSSFRTVSNLFAVSSYK